LVRKELNAIVLIRIVRRGDDHADVKIVVADKAGDTGRSKYARKGHGSAALREASGHYGSDVWTGFPRISSDEGMRRGVFLMEVLGDGTAQCKEGGVVEGRNSRDAADAVCSKKLSWHSRGATRN